MNKDGLICWNCQKDVPYSVKLRRRIRNINGVELDYMEKYGECDICHSEIMVPGLIDENERNADSLYRAKKDVITIDEIKTLAGDDPEEKANMKTWARGLGWTGRISNPKNML